MIELSLFLTVLLACLLALVLYNLLPPPKAYFLLVVLLLIIVIVLVAGERRAVALSMPVNKQTYLQMMEEDIEWLTERTEPCLERESIIASLRFLASLYQGGGDYKGYVFDQTLPANQP